MTSALGIIRSFGGMACRWSGMAATAVGGVCALKGASGMIYHGGIIAIKIGPTGLLQACCRGIGNVASNALSGDSAAPAASKSSSASARSAVVADGEDKGDEAKFNAYNARLISMHVKEFKQDGVIFINGVAAVCVGFLANGIAQFIFKGARPSFEDCTKFDLVAQ